MTSKTAASRLVGLCLLAHFAASCFEPKLQSLAITPQSPRLAKGTGARLSAIGTFDDGTTQDLTSTVTWSSTAPGTATVAQGAGEVGLVNAVAPGSARISASADHVSSSVSLTVTDATLTGLQLDPPTLVLPLGLSRGLAVIGSFSDGSTQDLTPVATLESSAPAVAPVATGDQGPVVTGLFVGEATVTATLKGKSAAAPLLVTDAALLSLDLTPKGARMAKGTTQRFMVTGLFSDGSTQDMSSRVTWSGSGATLLRTGYGVVTSDTPGSATVTAAFGGRSAEAALTVSAAALSSIAVTPGLGSIAKGTTQPFVATGLFSDGSTQDLTATATWSSESAAVATVSAAGLASAVAQGSTDIRASQGSGTSAVSGGATLVVSPAVLTDFAVTPAAVTLAKGTAQQFTARGTFSDGTTQDLTSQASWSASRLSFSPTSYGLATSTSAGSSSIDCTWGGRSAQAAVTVTAAALTSIAVTPGVGNLAKGTARQYLATGTFSDGTTQDLTATASWSSDAAAVATVSASGQATAVAPGSALLRAMQAAVSGSATLVVSNSAVTGLSVSPATATIAKGTTQQFTVTATFSDGGGQDVTGQGSWVTESPAVGTIAPGGLATGAEAGTTSLSVSFGGKRATASLTVGAKEGRGFAMSPAVVGVPLGSTQELIATLTYTDGSTGRIQGDATWSSSDAAVAAVDNRGTVTAGAVGTALITATRAGGQSASALVVVTEKPPVSLAVTPGTLDLLVGATGTLTPTATFDDGSTRNMASLVTWRSSDSTVATVSNAAGSRGQVTAIKGGSATLTAAFGNVTGQATVTVTVPPRSIWLTPTSYFGDQGGAPMLHRPSEKLPLFQSIKITWARY